MVDSKEQLFHKDSNLQKLWTEQYNQMKQAEWDKMNEPLEGIIKKVSFRTFNEGINTLTYDFVDGVRSYNVNMTNKHFTHEFNTIIDNLMTDIRLDPNMRHLKAKVIKCSSEDLKWQVYQLLNTTITFDSNNKECRNTTVWGVGCLYKNKQLAFDCGKYTDRNMRKVKLTRDGNQYYEYNFKQFEQI